MENETLSKKDLIMPIISIIAFLLLLGGASYAYFTVGGTGSAQNISANLQLPARCIASTSKTDCTITTPTLAQMTPGTANNTSARSTISTCQVNVTVNGNKGCTCSYIVTVTPVTNAVNNFISSVYVTNSISYKITGSVTGSETFVAAGWSGSTTVASGQSITIATTGTGISKTYNMTVNFYNRATNQDVMSGKTYKINLATNTPACSIPVT